MANHPKGTKFFKVRCLGPGKEHTFPSKDKTTERVCPACREKIANLGLSIRERPLPVRNGD